jgi:hypothetical protein
MSGEIGLGGDVGYATITPPTMWTAAAEPTTLLTGPVSGHLRGMAYDRTAVFRAFDAAAFAHGRDTPGGKPGYGFLRLEAAVLAVGLGLTMNDSDYPPPDALRSFGAQFFGALAQQNAQQYYQWQGTAEAFAWSADTKHLKEPMATWQAVHDRWLAPVEGQRRWRVGDVQHIGPWIDTVLDDSVQLLLPSAGTVVCSRRRLRSLQDLLLVAAGHRAVPTAATSRSIQHVWEYLSSYLDEWEDVSRRVGNTADLGDGSSGALADLPKSLHEHVPVGPQSFGDAVRVAAMAFQLFPVFVDADVPALGLPAAAAFAALPSPADASWIDEVQATIDRASVEVGEHLSILDNSDFSRWIRSGRALDSWIANFEPAHPCQRIVAAGLALVLVAAHRSLAPDSEISEEAERRYAALLAIAEPVIAARPAATAAASAAPPAVPKAAVARSSGSAMVELQGLAGLERVKAEANAMQSILSIAAERKSRGLSAGTPLRHLVFVGNPGTGKTTG